MTAKTTQTDALDTREILYGVRLLNPATDFDGVVDVTFCQNEIVSVDDSVSTPSGLWLFPGLVDMHVHLRTPGYKDAETLLSGLRAAIAGGVTAVGMMPNTSPALDNVALAKVILDEAKSLGLADVIPVPCVTLNRKGLECVDFESLSKLGIRSFSDDGSPVESDDALLSAFDKIGKFGGVVIEHPEVTLMAKGGAVNQGRASEALGVSGISEQAEFDDVNRCINLLKRSQSSARLHLTHVSSPKSIALIKEANLSGLNVTCDVTPHHLVLNENEVIERGTIAKMNPPLRSEESRSRLLEYVLEGSVTAIASDHAPHTFSNKNKPISEAAFGITGLETILPLTNEILFKAGMPPLEIIRLLTTAPAEILGIRKPTISAGENLNMVLFDPQKKWEYSTTFSKSENSPFLGSSLIGKVLRVWLNKELYREDKFV